MTERGWFPSGELTTKDRVLIITGSQGTEYVAIESVEDAAVEDVFDVTVEDTHCSFANGIYPLRTL